MTDNELNEMRNLKKKVDYLRQQLEEADEGHESHSEEEEEEEDVAEIQPKKKNIKAQRAAVSAEVYGDWNKKGDFKPKKVPKSEETRAKLRQRLMQAFMFNALDEKEFDIVVDAIEEVKV